MNLATAFANEKKFEKDLTAIQWNDGIEKRPNSRRRLQIRATPAQIPVVASGVIETAGGAAGSMTGAG